MTMDVPGWRKSISQSNRLNQISKSVGVILNIPANIWTSAFLFYKHISIRDISISFPCCVLESSV